LFVERAKVLKLIKLFIINNLKVLDALVLPLIKKIKVIGCLECLSIQRIQVALKKRLIVGLDVDLWLDNLLIDFPALFNCIKGMIRSKSDPGLFC
jgi:hypothetical protein